ncbi:hypothetical protein PAL_GLEAN10020597 [Pteropus alecto]|uniref:Uncharacterized protein n=1 Tax=Pteropus alecto TaxID=9402 RepID=L5KE58_PTEAL|nr:hypothetical protein PAL_GLEAN10020597 [Pteropus alecto]
MPSVNKGQQEHKTQKQHLVGLWVQFSRMMDTSSGTPWQIPTHKPQSGASFLWTPV